MESDKILDQVNKIIKQPNSVTEAKYEFTELQMNVLTMIIYEIQNLMTKNIDNLNKDLFNNIKVSFDIRLVASNKNYSQIIKSMRDLYKKDVVFDLLNSKGNKITRHSPIIKGVDGDVIDNNITLWVNELALPWLIYYGGGMGFTKFNPKSILSVPSKHSKRIYQMLAKYYELGRINITIEDFKKKINVDGHYSQIGELKRSVLEVAKTELSKKSDIWFDYKLYKVNSRSFTHIEINICGDRPKKLLENPSLFSSDGENVDQLVEIFNNFYFSQYTGFVPFLMNYLKKYKILHLYAEKIDKTRVDIDGGKYGHGKEQINKVRTLFQKILVEDFYFDNNNFELFGMSLVVSRAKQIKEKYGLKPKE